MMREASHVCQYSQKQVFYMIFVKVHIILRELFTFCLIFAGVKRLTFASKDAEREQLLGGTALDHSRDMQMPRYRRCRDTVGSEYNSRQPLKC